MLEELIIDGCSYVKLKDIDKYVHGIDHRNAGRMVRNDPLLGNYTKKIRCKTNGGNQMCWIIKKEAITFYLLKMNVKTFSIFQKSQYQKILDYYSNTLISVNEDTSTELFYSESCLRDEIYRTGLFDDVYIIDKEVPYDFGRVDLEGIDLNGKYCCIELKNHHAFSYIKSQLGKYKESNYYDRIIYISYKGEDPTLISWMKDNGIECYEYTRELSINQLEC